MHDLKLLEAGAGGKVLCNLPSITSPVVHKQLQDFYSSMVDVYNLAGVLPWVGYMAIEWERAGESAKKLALPSEFDKKRSEIMHVLTHITKEEKTDLMVKQAENIDQWSKRCGPDLHRLLGSILKAMLVQAWTTIEVLIDDLHGAVIDGHPKCFCLAIKDKRKKTLQMSGKRFIFVRRDGFQAAYTEVFASSSIDSLLNSDDLNNLCVLRNLIAHNGGIVDSFFMQKDAATAPGLKNYFPVMPLDQPLPFDGENVKLIIDAAVAVVLKLLCEVDSWITAHTP